MSLKTKIIALCEYALIAQDNKVSIVGIFDELRITGLPGGLPRAFFVATVNGKPETEYKITVKVEHTSGGKSSLNPLTLNIKTGTSGISNILVQLLNINFENEGDYRFVLYDGDNEVGSTVLKVILMKQNGRQNQRPN